MKIVFATNNEHKLEEIRAILGSEFEVLSLADIGCHEDIPETGKTLEDNAYIKAAYIFDNYHVDCCFADDTGLEVLELDNAPGIYSARYAAMENKTQQTGNATAESHDSEANMNRLLRELENIDNRKARFRTVIMLIEKKQPREYMTTIDITRFEGVVEGEITREKSGVEGFGYDPIFRPDGYDKTFAELGAEVKNQISHRAKAVAKLAEHLKKK